MSNLATTVEVHLGTSDRLLTMGASMVNLALQGRITIHTTQRGLNAALDRLTHR